MEELHSQGKTIEDITKCLNRVELNPHIISAIRSAHTNGYLTIYFFVILVHNFYVLHLCDEWLYV